MSAPRPRLVVLSLSAGAGHVRAAAALCAQAQAAGVEIDHLDVMQFVPRWFRWVYADMYALMVSHAPTLWARLYAGMNRHGARGPLHGLRRAIERRVSARWLAALAALAPDAVICTHFLPAEVLARRPGVAGPAAAAPCPLFVHVTDFDLHAMWCQPGVSGYFVACEEVADRLRQAGVEAARIAVSGIALMPAFAAPPTATAAAVLQQCGFDAALPTVLLMGGGGGFGKLDAVAAALLAGAPHFQLLVLAGRNASTLRALQALALRWPGRLAALGFTDQVAALMASADIVITKPGGLTTAEALASGVAMIVNAPIPGQEERNADFLLEHGAALKAHDSIALCYRLRLLLADPQLRRAQAVQARSLGRPQAARHIIDAVLGHLKATA